MHYPGLVHGTQIRNAVSGHGTFSTVTSSQPPTLCSSRSTATTPGLGVPLPSCPQLWGWMSPTQAGTEPGTQPPIWLGRESTSLLHQDICTELEGKSCLSN